MSEPRVVWKYVIPDAEKCTLSLPAGAQALTVQVQRGDLCLWALVQPGVATEARVFRRVPTGHPFDWNPLWRYIGTYQSYDGFLVFHVFECVQASDAGGEGRV